MLVGTRLGAYEVIAKLGEGGMGVVYRARDSKLKRDVALKVLPAAVAGDDARLARFQREAELLASLNHPHIAQVHGLEESDGTRALVMELVEGEDLSQRIARGPLPVPEVLKIGAQIASALAAAHDQGIIHRDLKPGNIRLRPDGTVKVLDFGLARSLAPAATEAATLSATSPGTVMGTPAYMSPEQASGDPAGRDADVWAFGVVLREMLTGVSPFARPTAAETLARVLTAPPDETPLPPETPDSLATLIRRCLERDRSRRWRDMGDARIALDEAPLLGRAPGPAAPAPVSRRKAIVTTAAAMTLAGTGFAGGLWLNGRSRPPAVASYRRITFRRGLVRSARVAPDGQTILYGALWDGDNCRVHTVRLDRPESHPLDLPNANLLAVSRSGELAIALGPHVNGIVTPGTLATVPIGGGVPRLILEQVKFADWSPDGSSLAIIRAVDGRDRLEYPIGTVLFAPDDSQGSGLGFPRVSPDGTRVAFAHYQHPSSIAGHVSVVDAGGKVTALTPNYMNLHGLAWRGHEILYTAADERPLFRAFMTVAPPGPPRTMARVPGNTTVWDALPDGRLVMAQTDDRTVIVGSVEGDVAERDLSWLDAAYVVGLSADGKQVLFTEYGQGGGASASVYLRGTDGSSAVRLGTGVALALSPDGRWALRKSNALWSRELELLPTGAGEPRALPNLDLSYLDARWHAGGRRLIAHARQGAEPPRVYVYDLDRESVNAITPGGITSLAISPDADTVAVRGPDPAIRLYGLDGSERPAVPGLTGTEVPVAWIDDGLLVMRLGEAPLGQIDRLDIRTGRRTPWKNILPRDRTGIMVHSNVCVTPDGRTVASTWHRALSNLYIADGLS